MEIQGMADYLLITKEFSLQQIVFHWLAKKFWSNFILRNTIKGKEIFIPHETEILVAHRKTVLNKVLQISNYLPKKLKDKLVDAVFCLQQGYLEALIWEKKCQVALPLTILNPMTAGEYQAGYYIDSSGHFNDFIWAKRFVADENQLMMCRFELACFYSFEQAIVELWNTMKNKRQLPFEGKLGHIKSFYGDLVGFWAYQLENEFAELIEEDYDYRHGFYGCGLFETIWRGHEYAARFFWERCSEDEKVEHLCVVVEFDCLSNAAKNNHSGLVSFIYSLLSLEQKKSLISRTIENDEYPWTWYCLLESRYYDIALNDILNSSLPIPIRIYARILTSLTSKMNELQNPTHEIIFKCLWNRLPLAKRKEVLELDFYTIKNLARIKAMDLLEIIIQPLSHLEKEKMLIYDWKDGGKSALHEFSSAGDYDGLRRYILFFLIDKSPVTQKLSLKTDAFTFLDHFIKGDFFIAWSKTEIPQSEEKEVNEVIENIQDSLKVLHFLLETVEEKHEV